MIQSNILEGAKSTMEAKNELIFKLSVVLFKNESIGFFNMIVKIIKIADKKIILDNISKLAFLSDIFHHR
jgi:hypothetical protein